MINDASPAGPAHHHFASSAPGRSPQARFEFLPAVEREPATVRAAGDIDLTNVGQFQAALDQAAAVSSAITADMTAVSTAGPITETLLKVSGLDQIATVVALD